MSLMMLVTAAGVLAIVRTVAGYGDVALWLRVAPAFGASLYFLLVASREARRALPAVAAMGFLCSSLLGLFVAHGDVGVEFYTLAPGAALLGLSYLLRRELGPAWTRHQPAR